MDACYRSFNIGPNAEVTVEAHPATINQPYLEAIHAGGINRLSIGVQSFSNEMLTLLGRHHSAEEAMIAFRAARSAGFDNIGFDLIYALPGQTLPDWEKEIKTAIELDPEHISIYGLSIEEGTLFHKQGVTSLSDEEQIAQYQSAQHRLDLAGFLQYEISNFAKAGRASRHNLLYWNRAETLGIGLSAHSYIGHEHKANTDSIRSYCEQIEAGNIPVLSARKVSLEEDQIDQIIFGLRKREGILKTALQSEAGLHFPNRMARVASLVEDGLLAMTQDRIFLTMNGMLMADEVAMTLL